MDKKRLHSAVSYLLRDDFTDTLAAGSVNATPAVPGPGTRVVADTENKLSLATGSLTLSGGRAAPNFGDPAYWLDAVTRAAGRILLSKFTHTSEAQYVRIGFDVNQSGAPTENAFYLYGATFSAVNSGANLTVGILVFNTPYRLAMILRATGMFYFIKGGAFTNWTLVSISAELNTATVYPTINNYDAALAIDYIRVPRTLWLPSPLASDGMTIATATDGLGHDETTGPGSGGSGVPYATAATWSIAGGITKNTPTVNGDIAINGTFAADTNWTKGVGWTIGGGVASAAAADGTILSQNVLTIGKWYKLSWDVPAYTGGIVYGYLGGTWNYAMATGTFVFTGLATSLAAGVLGGAGAGTLMFTGTIDNVITRELTTSELFRSLSTVFPADIVAQVKIVAMVTSTQAGIAIRLNSPTAPTSGIVAFYNGSGSYWVYEFSGATWTLLLFGTKTWAANDVIQLYAEGANLRLVHLTSAGVPTLIGTTAAASITTGGYHGVFSTDSANTLDNLAIYPRGSNGEYNMLNKWSS